MIVGLGVDLFEVARMEKELRCSGFSCDVFTPQEISYCERQRYPARHFAARFAAKEAIVKALAPDFARRVCWRDIEVCAGDGPGPRTVSLHGDMKALAAARGVSRVFVSMSHTDTTAMAGAVLEASP
jgi:holo-[acyl-carrier protein] synthase